MAGRLILTQVILVRVQFPHPSFVSVCELIIYGDLPDFQSGEEDSSSSTRSMFLFC